jgi:signal transduction histidine kinase/HAMP domain-containing protein
MFKAYNNLPIGRRISLIVLLITLVTLVIVVYLALVSTTQTIRAERASALVEQSKALSRRVDDRFGRIDSILKAIGGSARPVGELTISDVEDAVLRVMRNETGLVVRRITFYKPGLPVAQFNFQDQASGANYTISQPSADIPDDIWFLNAQADTWHGPQAPTFGVLNESVLSYNTPFVVATEASTDNGVIWADIAVNTIEGVLRQENTSQNLIRLGTEDFLMVVTPDGRVLSTYNAARQNQDDVDALGLQVLTSRNDALIPQTLTGKNVFTISTYMPLTGWRLVTVLPDTILPQFPEEAAGQVLMVSVVGMLVQITSIIFLVRRSVAAPITELSQTAQHIGAGDMRQTVDYQEKRDEIGVLARALEDMRASLQYSYDNLERRIERRTAELEIARKKAQATAEELRAVYDESLLVVSDFQLQSIIATLAQRIARLLNAEYCSLWLLGQDSQALQLVSHTSDHAVDQVAPVVVGEGLVGAVVARAEPLILEHYTAWERRLDLPFLEGLERALCVPMFLSGEVIGAIVVARYADGELFNDGDQRLMGLFANLASPAVRNAQLIYALDEARKEADRANQVKTRFLASVTHELRTPLNLIINNMDFMRIGAFGDVNTEQVSRLDQTIRSAEHLLYLINDLLDVSKIDAGEMQIFIQPTDVYPVIEDALDGATMQIEKDGKDGKVAIHIDVEDGLPPVPMDARRIRQVLHNLLSNAVKFTFEGEVVLTVARDDGYVRFSVRDTGIGIPEGDKDKMFQPFERTQLAKSMGIEGTGLGLPISHHLVAQHGGELTFTTYEGEGTVFSFSLPINGAKPAARSAQPVIPAVVSPDAGG